MLLESNGCLAFALCTCHMHSYAVRNAWGRKHCRCHGCARGATRSAGMHACSKHVETNPGHTLRAIILWHLHACCMHRIEGSRVQTLAGHAQANDEKQHLPSFNCDAYVSPQPQQTCKDEVRKNCTPRIHARTCTTCTWATCQLSLVCMVLLVFVAALLTVKQMVWDSACTIQHAADSCSVFMSKSGVTKYVPI